jgi:peptidoglycan hydrolase CwlO-like protein
VPIENVQLQAYVNDLRRRIEVQNDLMAALAKDVQKLQNEVEKLSLDLAIRQGEAPGWAEVKP